MSSRDPTKLAPTTPYKPSSSAGHRTSLSANPTTPQSRFSTSAFSSPGGGGGGGSSLHQVDEPLIFELGTRFFRAGFSNESAPRCKIGITPEMYGRVGLKGRGGTRTNRRTGEAAGPRIRNTGSEEWELWMNDLRLKDLGVVEDLMERVLRDAYNKHLLIESKSKRLLIIIPPVFPLALQNTFSQLLFLHFQPPSITYLPSPVLNCLAAGLRSALIVDIGWQETTITPVYELRPLPSYIKFSSRGSKSLVECFGQLLWNTIKPEGDDESWWRIFNWAEVEDLLSRYGWCKSSTDAREDARQRARQAFGLPKEKDGDEEFNEDGEKIRKTSADIRAQRRRERIDAAEVAASFKTPLLEERTTTLNLPFEAMSVAAEYAFFLQSWTKVLSLKSDEGYIPIPNMEDLMEGCQGRVEYEDESDYTLPYLVFLALLHCPVDVRAVCIPRIVITGGASNIPGLKSRILGDLKDLVEERGGWNIVKTRNARGDERRRELVEKKPKKVEVEMLQSEKDDLRIKYAKLGGVAPGTIRAVETMGAWVGGSILSGARIKGAVEVEREKFLSTHRM
ncbi:Actin-1 [Dactylellina cionopaga]|nr:Actin-1 [Dactylellina cionopaga]